MVLVKDKSNLLNSFHNHPEYLRDIDDGKINYHDMGIELSRPTRGLKLWMTLQFIGYEKIGSLIDYGINLARLAESEILHYENWEIVSHAQLAILTFRFAPIGINEKDLNEINIQISKSIVEDGYAAVFTTELNNKVVLRMCTINPNSTEEDIMNVIHRLDKYANNYLLAYKK
jgi:glutamate/tyrosine decarboxylase-like PLP-dependent enzyme